MNQTKKVEFETAVCKLILESPMVKIDKIEMAMNLDDINMDSLEKLSMAMDLEELYDIEVSDTEVEAFELVSDVVKYLEARVDVHSAEVDTIDAVAQPNNNGSVDAEVTQSAPSGNL
jgi:acyl carrier protein